MVTEIIKTLFCDFYNRMDERSFTSRLPMSVEELLTCVRWDTDMPRVVEMLIVHSKRRVNRRYRRGLEAIMVCTTIWHTVS